MTSKTTRKEDEVFKPRDFAEIGIEEYFLYDPTADYLRPPLRGYRWERSAYAPIEPNARGLMECQSLSITFKLDGKGLVLRDLPTGAVLLTSTEAERDAEKAARQAAEARAAALEDELLQLRAQLGEK